MSRCLPALRVPRDKRTHNQAQLVSESFAKSQAAGRGRRGGMFARYGRADGLEGA